MKIHLDNSGNLNVIDSYGQGFISIKGKQYYGSLCVMPTRIEELPNLNNAKDLSFSSLEFLLQWEPELILLGTGGSLVFPDMRTIQAFYDKDIGCDVMDSAAACRTYNVLVSEGRSVATIILQN